MINVKTSGDFKNTERFLTQASKINYPAILKKIGQAGVIALASNTPFDSGLTADSWKYEIHRTRSSLTITWTNSNVVDGVPIAIIIQYGHATRNGSYIQGRDYINPALRPIFDSVTNEIWEEATR